MSRRVAGLSPRPDLNIECGLLLGEVPVHLLGPAVVPLSKAPDIPLPPSLPLLPGHFTIAIAISCPLLLVLGWVKCRGQALHV